MYLMLSLCFKGFSGGLQVKGCWELWGKQPVIATAPHKPSRDPPPPAYLQAPGCKNSWGGSEGKGKGTGQAAVSSVARDLQVLGWEKLAAEDA